MSQTDSKVIVITGCSSGIGLETAVECSKAGHKVFATMKNLENRWKLDKRIEEEKLENIVYINVIPTLPQTRLNIEIKKNDTVYLDIMGCINRKIYIIPNIAIKYALYDYDNIFQKIIKQINTCNL